jgi:hypothetical protein
VHNSTPSIPATVSTCPGWTVLRDVEDLDDEYLEADLRDAMPCA